MISVMHRVKEHLLVGITTERSQKQQSVQRTGRTIRAASDQVSNAQTPRGSLNRIDTVARRYSLAVVGAVSVTDM